MKIRTLTKKFTAIVVALAVLVSCMVVSLTTIASSAEWDGMAAQDFAEGTGTVSDPFLVSTPSELKLAVTSTGLDSEGGQYHYKMTNNIYLNEVLSEGWTENQPNEWAVSTLNDDAKTAAFKGVFDGDGYMVYGLYVSKTYTAPEGTTADRSVASGLFPTVGAGAVIKGVGIDKAYLSLTNDHTTAALAYAGQVGLIGYAYNVAGTPITIDRCFIGTDVTMKAVFAGLVGDVAANSSASVVMTNCYAVPQTVSTFNEPDKVYIYNNRFMIAAGRDNSAAYKLDYCYTLGNLTFSGSGKTDTKYNYCTQWTSSALGNGNISSANMKGNGAFDTMPGLNTMDAYQLTSDYPTLKIFDKTPANVWDGTTATPTALDDNGNLIIGTAEELAYVVYNGGGADYILTNDIYLNDITAIDWSTGDAVYGYNPREWYSSKDVKTTFSGTLDGNGHVVYGMYYSKGTPAAAGSANYGADAVALIPRFAQSEGTVKNIGVDKAYIKATNCAAGIVGNSSKFPVRTIENCYAGENVYINAHVAGGITGGGDGSLDITNCYSLATLNATHQAGGILGGYWTYKHTNGTTRQVLTNCYSTTALFGNGGGTRTNCYGGITEDCKGQGAILNFPLGEPYCATDDSYPTLRVFKQLDEANWNGLGIDTFEGEGTEDNPYIVENAGQLAYLAVSGDTAHYKMVKDIYINDVSVENWQENKNLSNWLWETSYSNTAYQKTTKQFKGTFDGNGYVIHGIWYSPEIKTQSAALFLATDGATVKNLGLKNSYLYAGYTKQWAIDNGYTTSDNAADATCGVVAGFVGYGICGSAATTISGCFVDQSVYMHNYSNGNLCATGGIAGYVMNNSKAYINISDCWSAANLSSGNSSKCNGMLGSAWTGYYTATNTYSLGYKPFMIGKSVTSKAENAYSGNYSNIGTTGTEYTVLTNDQMMGENALSNLVGFSDDVWYAVKESQSAPLHRIYGTAIGDVDENGAGKGSGDIVALRTTLIGTTDYRNTDFDRNGKTNICDLVEMNIDFRPILTFNANGGSFSGSKTTVVKEQTIGTTLSVEKPTQSNYGCIGWSLTPDGEVLDSNIVTAEMDGITLYAVWKKVLVTSPAFVDNMILQRNKPICVYGTGSGEGEITIGDQTKRVVSDGESWEVYFEPMEASTTPVTFKTNFAGIETEYKNVLIGDVYIASGQSNMEFKLQSTEQTGTVEGNSLLRFRNRGTNTWNAFTAENVEAVSGIGVLFAQELGNALDNSIPIGIVCTAVGASRIEDWIHSDYCFCEEYEFETLAHSDYSYYDQGHHDLYTKHILPIEKMTTAGVLWYQGESNRGIGEAYRYLDMFEVFVDSWRTRMDDPTLPFYTVQIMLYTGDAGKDRNGNAVDEYNIRIAQGEAARTIEGVTVCTMLSLEDTLLPSGSMDIHPTDKLPVAKALANAALTTYYYPQGDYDKTPEYSGPLYKEITVNEGTATITFNHVAEGLMLTSGDTVTELEVRDSEGNWVAATGNLSNNTVTVTADGVAEITGVRMGYHNRPSINLFNTIGGAYGYCASPFVWIVK